MFSVSTEELDLFHSINWVYTSQISDVVMIFLSSPYPWVLAGLYLCYACFFEKKLTLKFFFLVFIVMGLSDSITHYLVKPFFGRARPCHVVEVVRIIDGCGGLLGLPSNHATNSFLLAFILGLKTSRILLILFLSIAFMVSYSRIYVGVHYPSDVLLGLIFASSYFLIFLGLLKFSPFRAHR